MYAAYRLQVTLPAMILNNTTTGKPDIIIYSAATGNPLAYNLWGIDQTHNTVWFDGSMEGQEVHIVLNAAEGAQVDWYGTVSWQAALPETAVPISDIVNEGQASAALEWVQLPLFDPVTSLPIGQSYTYSKLWVFWTSNRKGAGSANTTNPNTDVYYEALAPLP
jgi:hypothetical protein